MVCLPQSKRSGTFEYRSQYDDAYRLTREKCTPGGGSSRMAYDYRYYFDGVGNRTKFIRTDLWTSDRTVVYEYSARNELTRYSDPEGTGRYWVCEYDLRGNRTKGRHTFWTDSWYSYEWDAQDRLTKVYSNSNTKTTEYKYDHAGRRAAKRVNSGAGFGAWTWYSYDGLKVVAEGTSSTSKMYYTTAPGDPGGIICRDASAGTNPLYYHYDRLGNVMAVTDSNGALCAPYTMDAFGNVLQCGTSTGYSATQSDPQPYHLTTKEWDPDSGLFYFNARWYERGIGAFVSSDQVDKNGRYAYCYNNPVNLTDPSGRSACPSQIASGACEREKYYIQLCWRKTRDAVLGQSYQNPKSHCGDAAMILERHMIDCLDHYKVYMSMTCCSLGTMSMMFGPQVFNPDTRVSQKSLMFWFPDVYQNVVVAVCLDGTFWYFDPLIGTGSPWDWY